jgi:hypothetical protein
LGGFDISDRDRPKLMIYNSSPEKIIITEMWVHHWPPDHLELEQVKLGKDRIWENFNGDGDDPPAHMPPWTSPDDKRDIKPYENKKLEFRFKGEAGGATFADYNFEITFEIEGTGLFCTLYYP